MSNTIGPVDIEFLLKSLNFNQESEKMKAGIRGITATAQQEANNTNAIFKNLASGIGVYFSASFLKSFVSEIANVRGEFQQLEIGLTTILKSKSEADRLMKQVVDFAVTTPFSLKDVSTGAKQLLAYGFAAKDVVSNIKMLGDVSAGLSIPISDLIYLYGTLNTQGRAYTRDILQFTSRGIPIISELAKQYGVTKEQISKMVEAGEVGFPAVEKAFKSMTSEGGTFFNLIDNISTTIPVQISNFKDAFTKELNDIGKANEGLISGTISSATLMVGSFDKVLDVVKVLVTTYGVYKAATIAVAVADSYSAAAKAAALTTTSLMSTETVKLTFAQYASAKAQGTLNAVMSVNPYVLAVSGIAALITALYVFGDATDEAAQSQAKIDQGVNDTRAKVEAMVIAINSEKTANADKAKALKELNGIMSSTVGILDAKTLATQKGKDAIDKYIDSIRKQAEIEDLTNKLSKNMSEQDRISGGGFTFLDAFKTNSKTISMGDISGRQAEAMFNLKEEESFLKKQLELKMAVKKEDGNALDIKKRTLDVIEQEIEAQKKLQKETSNKSEYNSIQKKIDALEAEKIAITGVKDKTKEIQGEYNKIEAAIKKAADAVVNANEKERPALQEKLAALVKQKQAWEDIIKAQRGEVKDLKPIKLITKISGDSVKTSELEFDKLNKKVEETGKQADKLKVKYKNSLDPGAIDVANEKWEKQSEILREVASFLEHMVDKYTEQLGLTEQQSEQLSAMVGIVGQLASGNLPGALLMALEQTISDTRNAEIVTKAYARQLEVVNKLLLDNQRLLDQSARFGGSDEAYKQRILLLKKQEEIQKQQILGNESALDKATWEKRNSLFGFLFGSTADERKALEEAQQALKETQQEIEDTQLAWNDFLRGGLTENTISDSIAEGFQQGKTSVTDFADFVNTMLMDAVLSVFKAEILGPEITAMSEYVKFALSDNILGSDEVAKVNEMSQAIIDKNKPLWDNLTSNLNISGTSSSSSSAITGIQASASADAVNAMVGQLMAVRVDIKSILLGIASGQDDTSKTLLYMKQIAENTAPIYRLKSIEEGISEMNSTLKSRL